MKQSPSSISIQQSFIHLWAKPLVAVVTSEVDFSVVLVTSVETDDAAASVVAMVTSSADALVICTERVVETLDEMESIVLDTEEEANEDALVTPTEACFAAEVFS